jgi:hypothetical protein
MAKLGSNHAFLRYKLWINLLPKQLFYYYFLFILTADRFLSGGSGTTIRHNTQIRHITQNNTTLKQDTAIRIQ